MTRLVEKAIAALLGLVLCAHGQTGSTGALVGSVLDPSGSPIPRATIRLRNVQTNQVESRESNAAGLFAFQMLQPGDYVLDVAKEKFATLHQTGLHINVTETLRLELRLQVETAREQVEVKANSSLLQTDSAALGRVVDETAVQHLPLVTRNFTQIAVLSPGVAASVNNAMELGLGGGGVSQIEKSNDGIFVHGGRSYDNNFQIDGVSVSDVQGSSSASGGIPVPNPDTIQEFKMQTALYDASYGRYAGSNISIVTRSGSNSLHGSLFEFFRNDALNANDYFRNRTGQARGVLKQNQFGLTLGGPVWKDRLFGFGSYQGTRQINGLAAGQARIACSATLATPPLTDDRSPAKLGAMFGGMSGANGGLAINPDGSNINPVALTILNFKLPDGSFLIPNPQTLDTSKPIASQGFSTISEPCNFNEDQFTANIDSIISPADKIAGRFFFANDGALVTFPGSAVNPVGNSRGFHGDANSEFRVLSVSHTHSFGTAMLNSAEVGYLYTATSTIPSVPFHWSDVGVTESAMNQANELPTLLILGSVSFAPAFPRTIRQSNFSASDNFSVLRGRHAARLGGSMARIQDNLHIVGIGSFAEFLSWPDFLLGLDASQNGSGGFSNVFESLDNFGLLDRQYRAWEASLFGQDDWRISRSLTLNLGLRYERVGQFADKLGRNSSFDIARADPNAPEEGSVAGYIVASNFSGTIPPGVFRADNEFGNYAKGQDLLAPRLGFAWRVPNLASSVLRGGYGLYFSRPTGQAFFQNVFSPPFSVTRLFSGAGNASASFQAPFRTPFPTEESFPSFPPYLPGNVGSLDTVSADFRPAVLQQFGLNVQTEIHRNWMFEVGYVGTRGTHLQRFRSFNQAQLATPDHPVRGEIENTILNIPERVPIIGFTPSGLILNESAGQSWYDGMEASLTKRLSNGLQFLASYTFSKSLDTDGANVNATSSGNAITRGNQNDAKARRGRVSFDRAQRFIFSATYAVPGVAGKNIAHHLTEGWTLAGVVTIQSGSALTILAVNSTNVFGISQDRAQLATGCSPAKAVAPGSVESKLNSYFDKTCFTTPPVIGADGIGTDFGNSGTGIVNGPGQANADLAISRDFALRFLRESSLRFRGEFFNAFNHPQFSNPDNNFNSSTFGVIQATAVNPRVIQLALTLNF